MLFKGIHFLAFCSALTILAAAAEIFLITGAENPGINVLFGAAGCLLLIVSGNFVLRPLLQRAEDYYGGGEDDE